VTPTLLHYRQTLDGKQARSKRDLYLTLTVADRTQDHPSTITVPLGGFETRSAAYEFDPVKAPTDPKAARVPLGSANSIWIPNPFAQPLSHAKPQPEPEQNSAEPPADESANSFGRPNPPAASGAANEGRGAASSASASGAGTTTPQKTPTETLNTAQVFERGAPIAPVSITVAITETRRGNPIARALAGVLKGSRQGVVDALDPTKRAEAAATEAAAADEKTVAWDCQGEIFAGAPRLLCAGRVGSSDRSGPFYRPGQSDQRDNPCEAKPPVWAAGRS
jgi:hypothetical protein